MVCWKRGCSRADSRHRKIGLRWPSGRLDTNWHYNFPALARMEAGDDPNGEPGLTAEWESSKFLCPENEPMTFSSSTLSEDVCTKGHWSQNSISRSLQRAEFLLRSTFNPNLKRLFQIQSQDEEEENFVVAHNLVSRSSTRLLRLQQVLLSVAPSWQMVGEAEAGSSQEHHRTLRKLVMQRSLLLFIHEFTRRANLAATYISRVAHLLENQLTKCQHSLSQASLNLPSLGISLGSLSQEFRVHLNHWPCLFSRVQSDYYLRLALLQQTALLREVQKTLDSFRLQCLVLMEQYIHSVFSLIAKTDLKTVPKAVLEHILTGIDLYNQAVEEQRLQHSGFQLRRSILQQAHYSTTDCFPTNKMLFPSAFSAKELLQILAVHHAEMVAKELQFWASEQTCHICHVHANIKANACCDNSNSRVVRLHSRITSHCSDTNWEQLQQKYFAFPPLSSMNNCSLQSSSCHTCSNTSPFCISHFHLDVGRGKNYPFLATGTCGQQRDTVPREDQPHLSPTTVAAPDSVNHTLERKRNTSNCKFFQDLSPPATPNYEGSTLPRSGPCQVDHLSVEILFQVLASSNELLAPLVSHKCAPEGPTDLLPTEVTNDFKGTADSMTVYSSVINTSDSEDLMRASTQLKNENVERTPNGTSTETTDPDSKDSLCSHRNKKPVEEEQSATVQPDSVHWPHSVQWSDLGQSLMFADLVDQYCTLLKTFCSEAMWLQLHIPRASDCTESVNLQDIHMVFQLLYKLSQASSTGMHSKECSTKLGYFSDYLLVVTAHAHWDHELCRSLGSALKDKCLTNPGSKLMMSSSKQDRTETSLTTRHLLLLAPPLLSSLSCHRSDSKASGVVSLSHSSFILRKQTVSLVLASVQLSTVWVMTKAYQFLSSWSLSRFLLVSQGDLKILKESLQMLVHQTKSMVMTSDGDLSNYNQLVLRQQLGALERALCELQTFSSCVLRTFSWDCKRMSGEIFERTMPSAVHWRPGHKTGFPSSPSEYASLAAQTVIGQVLEGIAPLPDDVRVQALSITMTAFMEAWMEHILNKKIKFSVQGALQLKQDFDSIREMIQSDRYGLSADLHQRLLSLRVFQQVDSAVVCLLQQPQAKSYLHSGAWEPFTRCCPANANRDSVDAPISSSITTLTCMDGEDLAQAYPSVETADLPPVDPSTPEEPYLAPSLTLGAAQQQWLDLRIQHSTRRWRLPGLQCLSKSES